MPSAAVIVTTYNRPDALAAVLEGYLAQDRLDFELLVADDGSTPDTGALVAQFAARAPFPLHHVWQEDLGFRAGAARNRALARTRADYVIFTDGDCVPSRGFVSSHRDLAQAGWFLAGSRILLSERYTARVLEERLRVHEHSRLAWLAAWLRGDVNRALPLLAAPDGAFRRRSPGKWEAARTCNLSAWRQDLVRVNGFDERYSGWGLEDSDLAIRLLHAGVRHKSARLAAAVFHLWHRENERSRLAENQKRLDELLASRRDAALVGLDRYS